MTFLKSVMFLFVVAIAFPSICAAAPPARFEPPAGTTLLIVGQNVEDIQDYLDAVHAVPAGLMTYTSITDGEGLDTPYNAGDGTQDARKLIDAHPNTMLQIGLWMVDDCAKMASGEMDAAIDRLGDWIQSTHRPVLLRVGYEFDGPHNHYPPQDYIRAYRRLVDRFRKHGVRNVAYVWHSYAGSVQRPLIDWYPGDDYVDWVGLSYFNQPQRYMEPVVQFAKQHGKPVIIAESSPWMVQTKYPNAWNLWFAPLFKFIQANDIKALSYISCDWDATQQFRDKKWGDTRIQSNAELLERWRHETSQDRYLKSSPDLFKSIGYESVNH
jgi:hypothetical protein